MTNQDLDILAAKIAARLSVVPRWMSLAQATKYSNIGKARLIKLTKGKEVKGFQDLSLETKPWRFDKESIDSFMENQIQQDEDEELNQKALDILATVRI